MSAQLVKIDIAVTRGPEMARFNSELLATRLRPSQAGPYTLYGGKLAGGLALHLAPAELADVTAAGSRLQLNFRVASVDEAFRRALAAGGAELEAPAGEPGRRTASVRDPDGSSVVLVE